jgi:hypothetical protein
MNATPAPPRWGSNAAQKGMPDSKLRTAIALEAARLMYDRIESEYYTAKRKAAKRLCRRGVKPEDLPSNAEIRDEIQLFARLHEGERRDKNLKAMRLEALKMMRLLRVFRPRLIGSVMTGHVRKGSDIDLHVFTNSPSAVADVLTGQGYQFELEKKNIIKHKEARTFTHIHVFDRFNFELTIYPEDKVSYVFRSSVTGKAIERASIRELEEFLTRDYPGIDLDAIDCQHDPEVDPYQLYRMLLLPLENVKQDPAYHPEGDVLYHSLQVFELAREHRPYDEEFLLAALLHDVGKGLDPSDHVGAGLSALEGMITDRTRFFIANHMRAHQYRQHSLPSNQSRQLKESADFDDLLLLSEIDQQARRVGISVCTLDEALDFLRALERENSAE